MLIIHYNLNYFTPIFSLCLFVINHAIKHFVLDWFKKKLYLKVDNQRYVHFSSAYSKYSDLFTFQMTRIERGKRVNVFKILIHRRMVSSFQGLKFCPQWLWICAVYIQYSLRQTFPQCWGQESLSANIKSAVKIIP